MGSAVEADACDEIPTQPRARKGTRTMKRRDFLRRAAGAVAAPCVVPASVLGAVFLAWDNTDLVPARRMEPFGRRFAFLLRTLPFHLGFGLPMLVPLLNMFLLSYAPVGATLYMVEGPDRRLGRGGRAVPSAW